MSLLCPSPDNQKELAFSKDPQLCGSLRSPSKPQASCILAEPPRMSQGLLRIPPPKGYVFGTVQLAQASRNMLTFDPFPSSYCLSLVSLVLGLPFSLEVKISVLTSSSTQKQTEVSLACRSWAPNMFSPLSLPPTLLFTPPCSLHRRPAWYDLPPPPYSSDTESLNQADLPPYRSRSGSADSASSQAASSLLSVDGPGHSPGQPGPQEGTAEPRDSAPSQGTEDV